MEATQPINFAGSCSTAPVRAAMEAAHMLPAAGLPQEGKLIKMPQRAEKLGLNRIESWRCQICQSHMRPDLLAVSHTTFVAVEGRA
jgi:hypothetical protein